MNNSVAIISDIHGNAHALREVLSTRVGELVMAQLKKLDKVAYVRFASVYRSFEDIDDFRTLVDEVRK